MAAPPTQGGVGIRADHRLPLSSRSRTPIGIMVGSGRGAAIGVFLKRAETFEKSRKVDVVVFDKTGTLTEGLMSLSDVVTDEDESRFLYLTASVEAASSHPIGKAVALGAEERDIELGPIAGCFGILYNDVTS